MWYDTWHWAFWIAVAAVIVRLIIRWIRISYVSTSRPDGLGGRVLRLRLLTGEIGKEEFKRRLSDLRQLQSKEPGEHKLS